MEDSWVSCYVPGWIVVPFAEAPDSISQPPMECTRHWREEMDETSFTWWSCHCYHFAERLGGFWYDGTD